MEKKEMMWKRKTVGNSVQCWRPHLLHTSSFTLLPFPIQAMEEKEEEKEEEEEEEKQ